MKKACQNSSVSASLIIYKHTKIETRLKEVYLPIRANISTIGLREFP